MADIGQPIAGVRGDSDLAEDNIRARVGGMQRTDGNKPQPYEKVWQSMRSPMT